MSNISKCPACGGTGNCKWCSPKGSGKHNGKPCQMCSQSGICSDCGGTGNKK